VSTVEVNFDGLVGPTHNYAGLSHGNVASATNLGGTSNPREAALQGLDKMWALSQLGLKQGVLPPHDRPHLPTLRALGFGGSMSKMLSDAWNASPPLLGTVMSASPMWTANAATVSPSADTVDSKVHFTPANLVAMPHRSIEAPTTSRIFKKIFSDEKYFSHHAPLPAHTHFGDEGAANHTRLFVPSKEKSLEVFVYGASAYDTAGPRPQSYPARQTLEASQAVARAHGLPADKTVFAQQNPDVIDQGVFHNDVIAVGNGNVLFYHEQAFLDEQAVMSEIRSKLGDGFEPVRLPSDVISVDDAVRSYLFNSQLVSLPSEGRMSLIAPMEAHDTPSVKTYLEELTHTQGPIGSVTYFDLKQSMRNGGGPACLRLRVALTEEELSRVHKAALLDKALFDTLKEWVKVHYRDRIAPEDLKDPELATSSFAALDALTQILELGSIYDFQRD
jgi:succinylarginine dihydrolase